MPTLDPAIQQSIQSAFDAFARRDWSQAEQFGKQALSRAAKLKPDRQPNLAPVLNLLGAVCYQTGRSAEALTWYRSAIDAQPDYAETYNNLGVLLQEMGQFEVAAAQFEAAIEIAPQDGSAYFNYGNLLGLMGELPKAIELYQAAVERQPEALAYRNNLGNALQAAGQIQGAIAQFRRVLALNPDHAKAHINLGNLLQEQGNLDGALVHYFRAAELQPYDEAVSYNLALAVQAKGDANHAAQLFTQALRLNSRHGPSHYQMGMLLSETQPVVAAAHFEQAIAFVPNFPEAHCGLGQLRRAQGNLAAAIAAFQQAVALKPDFAEAHYQLGQALLAAGDYRAGWPELEWRWKAPSYLQAQLPRHRSVPRWTGQDLAGATILLWAEAGMTLPFVRYATLVAQRGGRVMVECEAALVDLVGQVEGVAEVIATGAPKPDCQWQIPLLSLPLMFETTLENIPPLPFPVPSVASPQKIGITWVAGDLVEFLQLETSAQFVSLQSELTDSDGLRPFAQGLHRRTAGQRATLEAQGITHRSVLNPDQSITDALADLDLILTTDGPIAHLAGTLGKPTWVVQPSDWLWLTDRTDSPWYPTVKLFQGAEPAVRQALAEALRPAAAAF
jgi:tetratricopeptide (TPR) repeat protein